MTHEKAIKELAKYQKAWNTNEKIPLKEAINYAINQLKQCQVFDEPVQMEVSRCGNIWYKRNVLGLFNGEFLIENTVKNSYYFVKNARPIKLKPLIFTDFCNEKLGLHIQDFDNSRVNDAVRDYTEYLKQFNEK